LKKIAAILLICIFICSQYARQFSYFSCVIVNTIKFQDLKCDCEKALSTTQLGTKKEPTPTPHIHLYIDEFFTQSFFKSIDAAIIIADERLYTKYTQALIHGERQPPWRPPTII
jgi:hypothetical protein